MPNPSSEPNWKARAETAESRLSEAVEALGVTSVDLRSALGEQNHLPDEDALSLLLAVAERNLKSLNSALASLHSKGGSDPE